MKMINSTEILTIKKKDKIVIEQEAGCNFLRIYPDKEDFNFFKAIDEIFRYIKKLFYQFTKKRFEKKPDY